MRLTKDMRANILRKAIANVPTINYEALLIPIVQEALCKHMPPEVKAVYDNEDTRDYLHTSEVNIRNGNGYGGSALYIRAEGGGYHGFYGLFDGTNRLEIRATPEVVERLKKGTLMHTVTHAVIKSGYFDKHVEQRDLFDSVKSRLRSTLESVTTVKRLYDALEPELHHLIPKEWDKTANLPATVAPVVDDLRKLGAQLPDVPKATK
jgi:hypothetical protein